MALRCKNKQKPLILRVANPKFEALKAAAENPEQGLHSRINADDISGIILILFRKKNLCYWGKYGNPEVNFLSATSIRKRMKLTIDP